MTLIPAVGAAPTASASRIVFWRLNSPRAPAGARARAARPATPSFAHPVALGAVGFQPSLFIDSQRVSQTAPVGQPAVSSSVVAVGPGPLTYQWLFNGTNIIGAPTSTFSWSLVKFSDAGTYSVVVVNSF